MEQTQIMTAKKSVRKDGNLVGIAMLLYAVINLCVSMGWLMAEMVIRLIPKMSEMTDTVMEDKIFDEILLQLEQTGTYLIVGVLASLGFLFLFFRKAGTHKQLFSKDKAMTPARFCGIACVFFGCQLVFTGVYELLEGGLNLIGFTAESSMEMATSGSMTASMFIYAVIVAPIVEELVYRGFVMRNLTKYSKTLAIIVSAIFFGVMHANIPQTAFAIAVGLVLGYVASEYSLIWSIVLHFANNLLAEILTFLLRDCSEQTELLVNLSVFGTFLLLGIAVMIKKRSEISAFIHEHKWGKPHMRWILTSAATIAFIVIHLLLGVGMIEKL